MQDLGAQPLPLDVRNPQQVQQAADTVSASELGLHAVVHNAGVGGVGLLAGWPDEDVQSLFDTNVFGPHRLTRALLPLLLQSRGRVVCSGSQDGSITSPFMGPYSTAALADLLNPTPSAKTYFYAINVVAWPSSCGRAPLLRTGARARKRAWSRSEPIRLCPPGWPSPKPTRRAPSGIWVPREALLWQES